MNAKVTVICAVWCRQKNKQALLRGHMHNLQQQTAPCEAVYVFDEGDACPEWLRGTKLSAAAPLTIYQAWNVALALVQTPYVMNLNLDDRLAPDAIERLQGTLDADADAVLAGGDWRICLSMDDTDAVVPAYGIGELPYELPSPPAAQPRVRLGSGDGSCGSYGPATMWRMSAHVGMPRFPYRFADGTLIRTIADAVWWKLLAREPRHKLVRLPLVIGHYYSDPASQAEYRNPAAAECDKLNAVGVSLK